MKAKYIYSMWPYMHAINKFMYPFLHVLLLGRPKWYNLTSSCINNGFNLLIWNFEQPGFSKFAAGNPSTGVTQFNTLRYIIFFKKKPWNAASCQRSGEPHLPFRLIASASRRRRQTCTQGAAGIHSTRPCIMHEHGGAPRGAHDAHYTSAHGARAPGAQLASAGRSMHATAPLYSVRRIRE